MKIVYDLHILVYATVVTFFLIFFWITLNGKKENKIIIIIDDFYHNTDIFQTVFGIRVNGSVHTDSCA